MKRGFTLNELLIVSGILLVLAMITLASVNASQSKGNDTSIKANLASIQIEAENFYNNEWNNNNASLRKTYGPASSNSKCVVTGSGGPATNSVFRDASIQASLLAISKLSSDLQCYSVTVPPAYVVVAILSNGNYWCIDSTGFSNVFTGDPQSLQQNGTCTPP